MNVFPTNPCGFKQMIIPTNSAQRLSDNFSFTPKDQDEQIRACRRGAGVQRRSVSNAFSCAIFVSKPTFQLRTGAILVHSLTMYPGNRWKDGTMRDANSEWQCFATRRMSWKIRIICDGFKRVSPTEKSGWSDWRYSEVFLVFGQWPLKKFSSTWSTSPARCPDLDCSNEKCEPVNCLCGAYRPTCSCCDACYTVSEMQLDRCASDHAASSFALGIAEFNTTELNQQQNSFTVFRWIVQPDTADDMQQRRLQAQKRFVNSIGVVITWTPWQMSLKRLWYDLDWCPHRRHKGEINLSTSSGTNSDSRFRLEFRPNCPITV